MIAKNVNYRPAIDLLVIFQLKAVLNERTKSDFDALCNGFFGQHVTAAALQDHYANKKQFYIFNQIQLTYRDELLHFDHIILTDSAFYVIDSQSVAGSIFVDKEYKWFRVCGDRKFPMVPPLELVEQKVEKLKSYLLDNIRQFVPRCSDKRLDEISESYTGKGYAAQAPGSEINGWKLKSFAENILSPDELAATVEKVDLANRPGFLKRLNRKKLQPEQKRSFSTGEMKLLVKFLKKSDRSLAPVRLAAKMITMRCRKIPAPLLDAIGRIQEETVWNPQNPNAAGDTLCVLHFCQHCEGSNISLKSIKNRHFFICHDCCGETPAVLVCPKCGNQGNLIKMRKTYFLRCNACGNERVFFTDTDNLN